MARLNPSLASGEKLRAPAARIELNLFPGEQTVAVIVRSEDLGPGRWASYGYVEKYPDSHVVITGQDNSIAATLSIPGKGSFQILPAEDQWHVINEIDPEKLGACGTDGCQTRSFTSLSRMSLNKPIFDFPGTIAPDTAASTNTVHVVDVMVVYTPEALTGAGSTTGMNTLIDLAVAEANTVFQNSQASVRLRLAYRGLVQYAEAPNLSTNLDRLQLKGDGFLDEVHSLRETNKADVVCMITEHSDPGLSGLAFTMGSPSAAFRDFAFSVVKRADAVGSFIFAHEICHNFGCQHDRENALDATGNLKPGAFPYSYGYRFTADETLYRTVMAYAPGQPIPYLSNPDILFKGVPLGVPGTTNGANNAMTVNNTAAIVSAFFGPAIQTQPPKIQLTSPIADVTTVSGVSLILTAQASDGDSGLKQIEFYGNNELISVSTNLLDGLPVLGGLTNLLGVVTNRTVTAIWTNVPSGEYRITARAVDNVGASAASQPVVITVRPVNDNFANRSALPSGEVAQSGSNRAGTREPNEADHTGNAGGSSVWYSWKAPKSGTIVLTVTGDGMIPLPDAYKSLSTNSLTSVTRDVEFDMPDQVTKTVFDAEAGVTYSIAVDALSGIGGDFTIDLAYEHPPANDDFSNRAALIGETLEIQGINTAATTEPGETDHAQNPGGKSVWYSWLAPKSGTVNLAVEATNFFPLMDVYIGNSIASITNVSRSISFDTTNNIAHLTFNAVGGQNYAFVVDGFMALSGQFDLTLSYPAGPPNDNFSDRVSIEGTDISFATSNLYAGLEPGEPQHLQQSTGGRSIWYSWTAPVSGPVTVVSSGDNFYTLPAVYTGVAVDALTAVTPTSVVFDQVNPISTLIFNAVAFKTYAIAIAGFDGRSGPIHFSLQTLYTQPTIQLNSLLGLGNKSFGFYLFGSTGQSFSIQAGTNLVDWSEIFRGVFATNMYTFTDDQAGKFDRRYYRVVPLP